MKEDMVPKQQAALYLDVSCWKCKRSIALSNAKQFEGRNYCPRCCPDPGPDFSIKNGTIVYEQPALNELKSNLSLDLFGMTIEQALSQDICIECKKTPRFYSLAGKKEYPISGLCEFCFDLTMLSREEAEEKWREAEVPEHLWPERKEKP